MYEVPYRKNIPVDDLKYVKRSQNQLMENFRWFYEVGYLLHKFAQYTSAFLPTYEIAKLRYLLLYLVL